MKLPSKRILKIALAWHQESIQDPQLLQDSDRLPFNTITRLLNEALKERAK